MTLGRQMSKGEGKPLSTCDYAGSREAQLAVFAAVTLVFLSAGPALAATPGEDRTGILPLALLTVVSLAFLAWHLFRRLTTPLLDLERCTRNMANGRLQELVPGENMNSRLIGRIGVNINELALNLQEVLLLVWNLSRQDLEALDRIARRLDDEPAESRQRLRGDLEFIRNDLEEMQEIVRQFKFFNVVLQDEKLLAKIPEPTTLQEREE
jgi:methyl-accepting chemotaxis protein